MPCGIFHRSCLPATVRAFLQPLEVAVIPITKHEQRIKNDKRGASRYAKRRNIDQKLRDMQLKKELSEVWT